MNTSSHRNRLKDAAKTPANSPHRVTHLGEKRKSHDFLSAFDPVIGADFEESDDVTDDVAAGADVDFASLFSLFSAVFSAASEDFALVGELVFFALSFSARKSVT